MTVYRYPGLNPFNDSEEDRSLFFGRNYEKEFLFHSILVNELFVLFGKSGIGKTSVINVGLMEQLRKENYLPIYIRFNVENTTPLNTIYTTIEKYIKEKNIKKKKVNDHLTSETESLWQYFKTFSFAYDGQSFTPVLILDQFEEFFTKHSWLDRGVFVQQLADVVMNRMPRYLHDSFINKDNLPDRESPPNVKIVISIREEFLGSLEEMAQSIPHILHNRYRLMPLTRKQAKEAIVEPAMLEQKERFKTKKFLYEPKMLNTMLDFLCEQKKVVNIADEKDGKSNDKKDGQSIIKKLISYVKKIWDYVKEIWVYIQHIFTHPEKKPDTMITDKVEPFQLQLLCRHIEQKIEQKIEQNEIKETDDKIDVTSNNIDEAEMEKVMKKFYDELVKKLSLSNKEKKKVREFCEEGLICDKHRVSLSIVQIKNNKKYKNKISKKILDEMVDKRLLRSESRVGSVYYELCHDSFVNPILASRSERERKKWRMWKIILIVGTGIFIFRESIVNSVIIPLLELMKIY